jgi:uncharacterized protein involved in high-affinity Fe2+ transport
VWIDIQLTLAAGMKFAAVYSQAIEADARYGMMLPLASGALWSGV